MRLTALAVSTLMVATSVLAEGGGSMSSSPRGMATPTPEQEAVQIYNGGISKRDKALKLTEEAKAATDPAKAAKLTENAKKNFERSVSDFRRATEVNPRMFQAYSELGFALRKLGKWDESLAAYDKALAIQPMYAQAIEYRAEAYLGLNKIDEAKAAYMVLFNGGDRARANLLFEAMKSWLEQRRADPGGVDGQQLEAFAKWVEQRDVVQKQVGALFGKEAALQKW